MNTFRVEEIHNCEAKTHLCGSLCILCGTLCNLKSHRKGSLQENHRQKRGAIFGALLVLSLLMLAGCNRGLAPLQTSPAVQPGFGGTIHFVSVWPQADSVQDLRVVAFYDYPPGNIFTEVTSGKAKVYPPIGSSGLSKFVDSLSYKFTLDSAGTFQYVVVAMQYGSNVLKDWKVVGAYGYSHGAGYPEPVTVPPDSFVNGIDLEVDFKNTPPTPLGGVAHPASRN